MFICAKCGSLKILVMTLEKRYYDLETSTNREYWSEQLMQSAICNDCRNDALNWESAVISRDDRMKFVHCFTGEQRLQYMKEIERRIKYIEEMNKGKEDKP